MLASEVLKRARRHLLEFGWHQGGFALKKQDANAPVCAEGALRCVMSHSTSPYLPLSIEARDVMCNAESYLVTAGKLPMHCRSAYVPYYNDYFCKSVDEVIEWFDQAIKLAERDENGPTSDDLCKADHGVECERTIQSPSDLVVTSA